jgi:hypothetical protein
MVAQLATKRPLDNSDKGLRGWTFMTVAFWGEQVDGAWTLNLVDKRKTGLRGKLLKWRISFWGTSKCPYDAAEYKQAFIDVYYPPSPDYFEDFNKLWSIGETQCDISLGPSHWRIYILTFSVLFVIMIAIRHYCRLFRFRRYRPVAGYLIQTM